MRGLIRSITFCVTTLAVLFLQTGIAQSVLDPNDPVVNYNSASPPVQPGWMQMGKWVRTPNTAVQNRNPGWSTSSYKAYMWQGMAFRLRFPKNYSTANDGKKYPLIIFLHGKGEVSKQVPNYDNEFQLLQGPHEFEQAILNDTWNGYVLAPQVADLYYGGDFDRIIQIVDYMIANNKVDPFSIIVDGLSSGGLGCWQLFNLYPLYVSSLTPISSPVHIDIPFFPYGAAYIANKKFTPIWNTQGGVDTWPAPAVTQQVEDSMKFYGANYKRTLYPTKGHDTWYNLWAEPGFWPFINRSYQSNPWPLFGRNQFWPGQPVFATIGVMPGFEAYEWRRNGILLTGATGNQIQAFTTGVYDARIKKNGLWSEWSRIPVTVKNNNYRVEAEDYVAMSGVTLQRTQDVDGILNVTSISNNDWMDYAISPYLSGTYTLKLRLAAASTGGSLQILNGTTVLATVTVPRTSSSQTWTTVTLSLPLAAGPKTLRIKSVTTTTFNINWMEFSMTAPSTLPVKFVYFNAQCDGAVNLKWSTAGEQNSQKFAIQRSADGRNWSEIGSVAAAGQSSQQRTYTFADQAPNGAGFYRIIEYDYDGQSSMSSIIKSGCSAGTEPSLHPNPSSDNTSLDISLQQKTSVKIQVIDGRGAVLQQKLIQLPAGSSNIPLNVSDYAPGIYTIMVQYNAEVKTLKLVKK